VDQHPCIYDEKLETNSNFVTLEKVEMGVTSNNIKVVILNAMGGYGGFTDEAVGLQVGLPWMQW
jgi:hypothetical protein